MIAFHFPPCAGTSGVHRAAKFAKYLPGYGWSPVVLTAGARAYPAVEPGSEQDLHSITVARAPALDAARHLAIAGRYARLSALPDRWVTWWISAVPLGLRLVRRFKPAVLWSTFPIATAHLVALTLHRLTGLPWVADFRDPMTEEDFPADPLLRRILRWVEGQTVCRAQRSVFTASSACELYRRRYAGIAAERFVTIPNGYDEEDFAGLSVRSEPRPDSARPLRLLHAGHIYRQERDPRGFFEALASLKRSLAIGPETLRVDLLGPSDEAHLAAMLHELDLDDIVQIRPPVPHRRALRECAAADALLLFQGPSCNRQIPAKVYEYLRIGRPILAVTDDAGDTARLLRWTGGAAILPTEAPIREQAILEFLNVVRAGLHGRPFPARVALFTRHGQTAALAGCLAAARRRRSPAVMSEAAAGGACGPQGLMPAHRGRTR
jgi:glycosyltransferase involved in cell wall biosynthesis